MMVMYYVRLKLVVVKLLKVKVKSCCWLYYVMEISDVLDIEFDIFKVCSFVWIVVLFKVLVEYSWWCKGMVF